MHTGDEITYLKGVITVRKRADDFMAFITGDERDWVCSPVSSTDAMGRLIQSHPEQVIQALRKQFAAEQ